MGRKQKNNADYFPHDNGMRNDKKIKAVRGRFGLEGYAIYSMILESLSESNLICIKWNDIEIEMMAGDFGIESEKLKKVVDYFLLVNLFQLINGVLFCFQLDDRLRYVFDKRNTSLSDLRHSFGISVTEKNLPVSKSRLPSRESKEKGSKGKERKVKNKFGSFENVSLTSEEFEKLKEKFNSNHEDKIENLSIYIESKGDKYKSHYATILSWDRKENKDKPKQQNIMDGAL